MSNCSLETTTYELWQLNMVSRKIVSNDNNSMLYILFFLEACESFDARVIE
mgnify:CR=1 FL=1